MAEAWGNQVHHWQAYVEASVTSETTTTATITCKTYWHSIAWGYSVYGHGYGVIGSTTGTDSGTVVFSSGTGASVYQLLTTETKTISKTDKAQSVTCKGVAIMTGRADANGTSTAECTVSIPAIAYETPNAPSGCSATRNSDAKATVTWTNGSTTTTKPRTATLVERQTDGGSWAQVASVGASATSYADNGIAANHRYAYRVRAQNTAGKSGYATSGYIYTTPAAPTAVTVSKTTASTVQVAVTGAAPYASAYDVAVTIDGGTTWDTIAQPTSMPYVDANAPAGTVQYRVRAIRGSLASAWTVSNQLVTITPPLAPTITAQPSNPTALDSVVTVGWVPNHPDGTAQSAAQVRVTDPSGTATTYDVSGDATAYSLACATAGTWSAMVRTHGLYDGWGEWSTAVSWGVYAPPVVVITSPASDGSVVDTLPLGIAWEVTDPTGVSSQTVTLRDSATGATVWEATLPSGTSSVEVHASDAPSLANGTAYALTVAVTGGSGLSATATREFATDWAAPATPTAMVTADADTASVAVVAYEGASSGSEPATVSLMVVRVSPDGSRWVVADGMASGDTAVDPLPPLGVQYAYEVTATAETGATSATTYTEQLPACRWAVNYGRRAEVCYLLGRNPEDKGGHRHGGERYHFAGRGLPVWYPTDQRDSNGSLDFEAEDMGQLNDFMRTARSSDGLAWLRDPWGNRWLATVEPDWSRSRRRRGVSIAWDAVEFEEAW